MEEEIEPDVIFSIEVSIPDSDEYNDYHDKDCAADEDVFKGFDEKDETNEYFYEKDTKTNIKEIPIKEQSIVPNENAVTTVESANENLILQKPFKCDYCQSTFNFEKNFILHKTSHSETPISCAECNTSFKRLCSYLGHIKIHLVEDVFPCTLCGAKFEYRELYNQHLDLEHKDDKDKHDTKQEDSIQEALKMSPRTETTMDESLKLQNEYSTERDFKCSICNKNYYKLSSLKIHMNVHTNMRPYSCAICNQGFLHYSSLVRHVKSHNGPKLFKCPQCPKKFFQKVNMETHFRRKHMILPKQSKHNLPKYKCSKCSKLFEKRSHIAEHIQNAHKGKVTARQYEHSLERINCSQLRKEQIMSSENTRQKNIDSLQVTKRQRISSENTDQKNINCSQVTKQQSISYEKTNHKNINNSQLWKQQNISSEKTDRKNINNSQVTKQQNISSEKADQKNMNNSQVTKQQNISSEKADHKNINNSQFLKQQNISYEKADHKNMNNSQVTKQQNISSEKTIKKHINNSQVMKQQSIASEKTNQKNINNSQMTKQQSISSENTDQKKKVPQITAKSKNIPKITIDKHTNSTYMSLLVQTTSNTETFQVELKTVRNHRFYYCPYCSKEYQRTDHIAKHIRNHIEQNFSQCKLLPENPLPINSKKQIPRDTNKNITCIICGQVFKSCMQIDLHAKYHHPNTKMFGCRTCGKKFQFNKSLKYHRYYYCIESNPEEILKKQFKINECAYCGDSLKTLIHLKYHQNSHMRMKYFKCYYCQKKFQTLSLRNVHNKVFCHRQTNIKCDKCDQHFLKVKELNKHKVLHHIIWNYPCPLCKKSFKTGQKCREHIETHQMAIKD